MKNKRRDFLKLTGLSGLAIAGGFEAFASPSKDSIQPGFMLSKSLDHFPSTNASMSDENLSIIGPYGQWAASFMDNKLPSFSFRKKEWPNLETWRESAKKRIIQRMAIPDIGGIPQVKVSKQYNYDGLHIEELSWQLPYGRPTEAILLKPVNQKGPLPGILAFHDHGGNKYFGSRKITRTSDHQHPMIVTHQQEYYSSFAWANEIAKRGYVVLVPDVFPFASRRVMMQDVPEHLRQGLHDNDPENQSNIDSYNQWAGGHEHIMAKSLFSAGTTWPGVFFGEDKKALDVLTARKEVDANRIGCAGLSGGGLRTVFMGGLDSRVKCAIAVGFMTTWKDFILNKSFMHTWMAYVLSFPMNWSFLKSSDCAHPWPLLF